MVLPDGSLFGEGVKTRIKQKLLEDCNLHTIVRLPNGVFAPYTGINTNLLFFTKGEPTEEVWYFAHPMPDDRKQYSKTRPIELAEFDLEKAWWENREESEYAWRVPIDEIVARNYNLDISNPNVEDPTHGDPVLLLARIRGTASRDSQRPHHTARRTGRCTGSDIERIARHCRSERLRVYRLKTTRRRRRILPRQSSPLAGT